MARPPGFGGAPHHTASPAEPQPIAAKGYDDTTVEQIAAAAEISPSTFFRYFPTKEDASSGTTTTRC
ncbi:MAG TPA: TetR family transcriptional regulator [Actinomycetota bacterium]|nr:TetR family transcriptional regulator [Actinomycetota bacterium]